MEGPAYPVVLSLHLCGYSTSLLSVNSVLDQHSALQAEPSGHSITLNRESQYDMTNVNMHGL